MTQIKHLQSVLLQMMKDIDSFCRNNGIEYYLFAGTALGAKRHGGFIPWDDDLDIALTPQNYDKFISLAKVRLNNEKYYFQEGETDWPEHFSKVRLRNTHIREKGEYFLGKGKDGIYIDIFRVDYASNNKMGRMLQYFFGKLWLAYNQKSKGYHSNSISKKIILKVAGLLEFRPIYHFVRNNYLKYNASSTKWIADVMGRTRWNTAFIPSNYYGTPTETNFEGESFFAPEYLHEYLQCYYGDYMQLPPIEKRKGLHIESIDFGNY